MCDSKSFPLAELCSGTAHCSDNSDESSLLCEGMHMTKKTINNMMIAGVSIATKHANVRALQ